MATMFMLSSHSVLLRASSGEDVLVASLIYNATISALEVRAYRVEGSPPALADKIGKSPLRIFETVPGGEDLRATVHFETATLAFAWECDPGGRDRNGNPMSGASAVKEVVVLRGLRIETH